MRVGILALQGDVEEHEHAIRKAAAELGRSIEVVRVKKARDLGQLSALFLPGGESTTFSVLAPFADRLKEGMEGGLPVFATCAGTIFLAKAVRDAAVGATRQKVLGVLDIEVVRNAYGRQKNSFEAVLEVRGVGEVGAVFIRAPAIVRTWGQAEPLAYVDTPAFGRTAAVVSQGPHLATTFHPELSTAVLHAYFLQRL
ncbi:MAG: pyridoxal 5'-phosphate synthase glutaminase subunit PdxT [Pyrobaculum sp.]